MGRSAQEPSLWFQWEGMGETGSAGSAGSAGLGLAGLIILKVLVHVGCLWLAATQLWGGEWPRVEELDKGSGWLGCGLCIC